MTTNTLDIREITTADCEPISAAFRAQGWNKPVAQYQAYCAENATGTRVVLVAEWARTFAGYVTLVWDSDYAPFRAERIPEVSDFNVLWKYRQRGVGRALMEAVERRAAERAAVVGLGVGLTPDYGAAQVLYVRRGYVPDGRGLCQRGHYPQYGESVTVDDDLVVYLVKRIRLETGEAE